MAQPMMCPGCKSDIPEGVQYCSSCFLTPVPKPAADPTEPAAEVEPPAGVPTPAVAAGPSGCGDPDCVHAGVPPEPGCRHCGLRGRATAGTALRFEWGPVPVPPGRPLVVGREQSPIADRIDPARYGNVSRRHAEISSDGTSLTVTDLGSMNGTFLNDERLPAGRATPLKTGDRVRFAARLEATVTGGPE
ncbi:FHA domain-containing protein [Actinoplanes sp. KI2]|uniref:FHA domain-containing protein n=1 Tax=Actinoplanes sp. KI2 TaxID=2983315 RepID=UPI0021D5BB8F|nr:FHA domain-containing protein [Actinoplanes sp. KI2]MCU7730052.1 FHA domain-containing protein [Actinoplanes sp. KI2]